MREDDVSGDRADRQQLIMLMSSAELHKEHPFVADLIFNEVRKLAAPWQAADPTCRRRRQEMKKGTIRR